MILYFFGFDQSKIRELLEIVFIFLESKIEIFLNIQMLTQLYDYPVVLKVRDLSLAYLLVGLTYLYVGVLIFASFPSPELSKECIEPVSFFYYVLQYKNRH